MCGWGGNGADQNQRFLAHTLAQITGACAARHLASAHDGMSDIHCRNTNEGRWLALAPAEGNG